MLTSRSLPWTHEKGCLMSTKTAAKLLKMSHRRLKFALKQFFAESIRSDEPSKLWTLLLRATEAYMKSQQARNEAIAYACTERILEEWSAKPIEKRVAILY